jgi:hypothetical protein
MLSHLVPLGERFFEMAERMKSVGFSAFWPLLEWQESFCDSPEELALCRQVRIEVTKELLGNFWPHPYLRDDPGPGYRSPLLQQLRKARAERGYSFDTYDRSKPWLLELDPCKFRRIEFAFTHKKDAETRRAPYLERHSELRRQEVARYATSMSLEAADQEFLRRALCVVVLADALREVGFQPSKEAGRRTGTNLVEKPLAGGWRLSWSVDYPNLYQPTGTRPQDQHGFLDIQLDLLPPRRKRGEPKSIASAPLRIGYNFAAPIDATEWDYGSFLTMPELETLLRAHAKVYSLMSEEIEQALLTGLRSLAAE